MQQLPSEHPQVRQQRRTRRVAAVPNRTCIRVAIHDQHELTMLGLKSLLTSATDSPFFVVPADAQPPPDVVLYSVHSEDETRRDPELHAVLRSTPSTATIIATYWDENSSAIEAARACGVQAALSQRLPGHTLLELIQAIHEGRCPDEPLVSPDGECHPEIARTGLTARELEVMGLIAEGLTNQEIADRLYLSINSIKTYVRTAYAKLGVQRRSQAVLWAERHGLTRSRPNVVAGREEHIPTA
jgi:NarL family two-component system response regulator LiaR